MNKKLNEVYVSTLGLSGTPEKKGGGQKVIYTLQCG